MLTQERLRELLNYDAETGIFSWKNQRGPVSAGSVCNSINTPGYIQIQIDGKNHLGHRLAWLYVYGVWPGHTIDHINRNKSDNRIQNLRDVPHAVNLQNLAVPRNSSTRLIGVSKIGNRYRAYITVNGKQRHLGCAATADEAYAIHLKARRTMYPGSTL